MICIIGMMGFLHHAAELGEADGAVPPAETLHGGTGCCRDLWVLPPPPRPSPCPPEKDRSVVEGWLTERRLKGQDQVPLPSPAQRHLFLCIKPTLLWARTRPQPHSTLGHVCSFHGHTDELSQAVVALTSTQAAAETLVLGVEAHDTEFPPLLFQSQGHPASRMASPAFLHGWAHAGALSPSYSKAQAEPWDSSPLVSSSS